jgi:DNA polymerase-3 subunit gamma/tau
VQLYYQIALLGRRDLSFTPSPQQGFEMTILRMLAFQLQTESTSTSVNTTPTPRKQAAAAPSAKPITAETAVMMASAPPEKIEPKTMDSSAFDWRDILGKLGLTGMSLALASNCILKKMDGSKIELGLSTAHLPMLNPNSKERLTEAISKFFNKPMQLEINATTEELATPQKQLQQEKSSKLTMAKENIMKDPAVQKLIEMYDATVEVSLV